MLAELKHPAAPKPVRDWADNAPKWVEVVSPKSSLILAQLDLGESEAIALATEVHAEVVLIDEQAGRQEALRRGLKVAGTLSVLDEADQAGLVVFDNAIAELRKRFGPPDTPDTVWTFHGERIRLVPALWQNRDKTPRVELPWVTFNPRRSPVLFCQRP
ncbi:MAG: DUF3368 domain-containing protein [Acidobacteria bacterium]|nr:DUF3368 domain-containing protein [Acidobacteriota bacterium]